MTFKEYMPLANVTMKQLGSPLLDSIHMVLGLNSEFLGEFMKAYDGSDIDRTNILEELGDLQWYLANYALIWDLEITEDLENTSEYDALKLIIFTLGEISDLDKKLFAYNKQVSKEKRQECFDKFMMGIRELAYEYEIDLGESREKNIKKLRARYAGKFTEYEAINRNTAEEYKILSE